MELMKREPSTITMNTRHLNLPASSAAPTQRVTGPLDRSLPWVIELRIVGTASTVQTQVQDQMLIGRTDTERKISPEIDLGPFRAFANGVSRKHAMILIKNERLYIKDLASTNGTRLNGALCEPEQEYRLRHGDELTLGQLRLQVLFAVVPVVEAKTQTNEVPSAPLNILSTGKGQHILVIEDDKDVGVVFRMALEKAGFVVTVVENVTKALGVVFQKMPDAIVLDLMLPDMNGLDLVRYVRKQHQQPRVPMLVVSGATGGFQMNQALEAGADAFLGKPVAVEELVKAVSSAVTV
jgi:CheY-like chemotaxis protein